MSNNLLNTLLQLFDDINALKKQMYTLEYQDKSDSSASMEYLQTAVSDAQFQKDLLRINITNLILDREEGQTK